MKKYYQFLGLALIMAFSFYYTERIAGIVLNKNPLMVKINQEAENYNVKSVNASINGDFIVPGLNGLRVNARESFYKMQESDLFNKYFLVYEQIKPDISLEDNKDKIIKKGNGKLKSVSLVLESNNAVSEYLKSNNIKASILTYIDTYEVKSFFENINNESTNFKSLENMLNLNKENKHICIVNSENKEVCLKNKNYLVNPELKLNSTNLSNIRKSIEAGSIILISEKANLEDVLLLLKEIKYKDLEVVYLSELIDEKRK